MCFITELANFMLSNRKYFSFVGRTVSVTTTQLCCCSSKVAKDNSKQVNKLVYYRLLPCFLGKRYYTTVLVFWGFHVIPCQCRNMPVLSLILNRGQQNSFRKGLGTKYLIVCKPYIGPCHFSFFSSSFLIFFFSTNP